MPIYEYRCGQCGAVSNHLARSFTTELHPQCPRCQSDEMTRLISRPGLVRMAGGDAGAGSGHPDAAMADYARRLRDNGGSGLSAEARDALDHVAGGLGGSGGGGELWGSSGGGAD